MTISVGVNLLWLVPGVVGGSEGYATGLLERLVDRSDVSVTAFALPGFVRKYPSLAEAAHTVVAPLPEGRHVVRRVLVENAWLASQLTKREIEVLSLVIEGRSSKEVADLLYVSKRTVDFHLANIYDKLDIEGRAALSVFAREKGLV